MKEYKWQRRDRKYNKRRYGMVIENKSLKDVRINASKEHIQRRAFRSKRKRFISPD